MEVSGQHHALAALSPGKVPPGTGLGGPQIDMDAVTKRTFLSLPGVSPSHPACSNGAVLYLEFYEIPKLNLVIL
jgi:hypothetical protein